jgi:hypothetical protein
LITDTNAADGANEEYRRTAARTEDKGTTRVGAFGRVFDTNASETVRCTVCDGHAERLSSVWQGEGITYHNYQCRAENCPAGGAIVEHEDGDRHRVGPVFGDRDLAVRLATREHPDAPAEGRETEA